MKPLFITIILLGITFTSYSITKAAVPAAPIVDVSNLISKEESAKQLSILKDSMAKQINAMTESLKALKKDGGNKRYISRKEWCLILSPILILFMACFVIMKSLKGKIHLADGFKENEAVTITDTSVTPPITKSILPTSSSRILAFMSGTAAIIVAICSVSYVYYMFILTGTVPDLSKFFDIILSLGIGVVPYGFNRLANGIKQPPPQQQ